MRRKQQAAAAATQLAPAPGYWFGILSQSKSISARVMTYFHREDKIYYTVVAVYDGGSTCQISDTEPDARAAHELALQTVDVLDWETTEYGTSSYPVQLELV